MTPNKQEYLSLKTILRLLQTTLYLSVAQVMREQGGQLFFSADSLVFLAS